jgi:hypothetical protein
VRDRIVTLAWGRALASLLLPLVESSFVLLLVYIFKTIGEGYDAAVAPRWVGSKADVMLFFFLRAIWDSKIKDLIDGFGRSFLIVGVIAKEDLR